MNRQCKLCQQDVKVRHTIDEIPYYYCSQCNFLQNFYWDDHPKIESEQSYVNDKRRDEKWPAGESQYMYEIGWQYLEKMVWPLAWHANKVHKLLEHIPGYSGFVKAHVKRKMNRILDYGCGHGVSILELHKRDRFDSLGLDPYSPTNDPRIIRTEILEKNFPDNSFDGIFTIETMEHIPNVLEVFAELYRVLKPGGVLLVQTTRLEHPEYQEKKEKWFYIEHPKTHVSIYSERAMQKIAKQTGWKSVQVHGPRLARFTK